MKCLLSVCLLASLVAVCVHSVVVKSVEAARASGPAQELQKGVSVEMAAARSAQPMPAADDADAWIITVTADGRLYFGVDSVTPAALRQQMIRTPRKRSQRLYIKADARASFSSVQKALDAASTAEFESPVLLVSQDSPSQDGPAIPGTIVSPKGLEIVMDGAANSGAKTIVEVDFAQGTPTVKIDGQEIPLAGLPGRLNQLMQNQKEKSILLRADSHSRFAEVAQAIDACRSAGATVVIAVPVV